MTEDFKYDTSRTIAIDFDGVIHGYSKGFKGSDIYDPPVEGAIDALWRLRAAGFKLVIFTSRNDTIPQVKEWCKKYLVPDDIEVTNRKPPALAYIDDRGIRFTNWIDILKYFV